MQAAKSPLTLKDRLRCGWRFLLCLVIFLVAQVLAGGLTTAFVDPKSQTAEANAIFRPVALVLVLLLFGAMARFLDHMPGPVLDAQGLGTPRGWGRGLLQGAALGAGMIVLCVLGVVMIGDYTATLVSSANVGGRLALVLWIAITAAALEEVVYRGYPFQTLVGAIGPWGAALALSVLFAMNHLANPHATKIGFLNTALVGMLLAIACLRTGFLWMAIGVHFAWNVALGTLFGLPVSGIGLFAVMVKGSAEGPRWLTGGDYGLEASATATVAILLGIAAVYHVTRPKKEPLAA